MSCISSNFSSFFLDSLNDPSEFAKYLGNGENKMQSFDDFQMFGGNVNGNGNGYGNHQIQYNGMQYSNGVVGGIAGGVSCDQEMYSSNSSNSGDHLSQQPQPHQYAGVAATGGATHPLHHQNSNYNNQQHHHHHQQHQQQQQQQQHQQIFTAATTHPHRWNSGQQSQVPLTGVSAPNNQHHHPHHHLQHQQHLHLSQHHTTQQQTAVTGSTAVVTSTANNHHFDGSFEFLKYLRHTSEYSDDGSLGSSSSAAAPNSSSNNSHNSLIDLDSSTSMKAVRSIAGSRKSQVLSSAPTPTTGLINRSSIVDIDSFDHDSKHTIFDLQHQSTNSNSNESSSCAGDAMSGAFASAHLNASNSNTSSEGGVCGVGLVSGGVGGVITGAGSDNSSSNQNSNASKPLVNFSIKENFEVHPAHKVEEGIFQHMNKLPPKKKETLKQLGVRFTGQMTLADKSIVVENFIKFCQEYEVTDHRPFLSLNQSGLNKPEQIKFARYLGQGLPAFTLFCIYSNFKNLFCTKRTETYIKDGYNLHYILDKTKRHLSCTTAELQSMATI